MRTIGIILMLTICAHSAWATDPPLFDELYGDHYSDSREMKNLADDSPTLLSFWHSKCLPCLKDMAMLPEVAQLHPELRIVLISLQSAAETRPFLPVSLPDNIHIAISRQSPEDALKGFGSDNAMLPYNLMLRSDGSICKQRYGLLGFELVKKWMDVC